MLKNTKTLTTLTLLYMLLICSSAFADDSKNELQLSMLNVELASYFQPKAEKETKTKRIRTANKELKGWDFLYSLLEEKGVEPELIQSILTHENMPKYKNLYFSVNPKESKASYRKRLKKSEVVNATSFYEKHSEDFIKAEKNFQVPKEVILAIMQMETRCGKFTGNSRIFPQLAKLAAASAPENIRKNFKKQKRKDKKITFEQVKDRGKWLENTFLPHTLATIVIAKNKNIHPLEMKGSYSGAIGLVQFLPGNKLTFGVDGNFDGKIDLFDPKDAIPSAANFLKFNGWKDLEISRKEQEAVIWSYNRSKPYVSTVLTMAKNMGKAIEEIGKEEESTPDEENIAKNKSAKQSKNNLVKKKPSSKKAKKLASASLSKSLN